MGLFRFTFIIQVTSFFYLSVTALLDALLDTNILGGVSTNYALLQRSALSRISNFVPAYLPVNASRFFPFPQCLSRRDKNLYLFINKTFLEFVIIYATWINITIFPFIVFSEQFLVTPGGKK